MNIKKKKGKKQKVNKFKHLNSAYFVIVFILASCYNQNSSSDIWDSFDYGRKEYKKDIFSKSMNKNGIETNNRVLQLFMSLDTFALNNKTNTKLFNKDIKKIHLKEHTENFIERTKIEFLDENYSLNPNNDMHAFPYYLYRYDKTLIAIVTGYPVKLAINSTKLEGIKDELSLELKESILNDYILLWKETTTDLNKIINNRIVNDSLTLEELKYVDSLDNRKEK